MANWTPVIESGGLANATIELLKSENTRLKKIVKQQANVDAKILNDGIEQIIQTVMKREAIRGEGLLHLDRALSSRLEDGWVDAGRELNVTNPGVLGKFMETDVFGISGDSNPSSDLKARYDKKGLEDLEILVELKAMLGVQDTIHIGKISVLKEVVSQIVEERDRLEYKHNLILYKMLIKMRNFMLAQGEAVFTEGSNTHVKFSSFTVYSKLIVEYIEGVLDEWVKVQMIKSRSDTTTKEGKKKMDKEIKSIQISNTPFKIQEVDEPPKKKADGTISNHLLTYKLEINYTIFNRIDTNNIDGKWIDVENSRKMYLEKNPLFNTPETRATFYAVARHLASLAGLEVE